MNEIQPFVGEFFSKEWIMRNVMRLSDEEIEKMKKEIDQEINSGDIETEEEPEDSGDTSPAETPTNNDKEEE